MQSIGILVPLPGEAVALGVDDPMLGAVFELTQDVLACVSGPGRESAAHGARALCGAGAEGLVSFGSAGGLHATLKAGALLVPARVLSEVGDVFETDPAWHAEVTGRCAALAPCPEPLVESGKVVWDVPGKEARHRSTGAWAVDMESATIAAVAAEEGRAFLALRAVSDPVGMRITRASFAGFRADGGFDRGAALRALLRRPQDVPLFLAAGRAFRRAQETLGAAARCAGLRF